MPSVEFAIEPSPVTSLCMCVFFSLSFNKLLLQKEELEQKHVHLLQVVESEKTAKWQYTMQCEELVSEIRKLRAEVSGICFSLCSHRIIRSLLHCFNL